MKQTLIHSISILATLLFFGFMMRLQSFQPESSPTPWIEDFESYEIGWFLNYNITSYNGGNYYQSNRYRKLPKAKSFSPSNDIDVCLWAKQAKAAGVDYVLLTVKHHHGFSLFPSEIEYNEGKKRSVYRSDGKEVKVPTYAKYNLGDTRFARRSPHADIIGNTLKSFHEIGIPAGLYFNIGKDLNIRPNLGLEDACCDETGKFSEDYEAYVQLTIAQLEELLDHYDVPLLWLDAVGFFPRKDLQRVYDAIKQKSPQSLVIFNTPPINGSVQVDSLDGFYLWPTDVVSFEEHRAPNISSGEYQSEVEHQGEPYYIPKEITATTFQNDQWFWGEPDSDNLNERHQPPNQIRSLFQADSSYDGSWRRGLYELYDVTRQRKIPLLLGAAIDTEGRIPEEVVQASYELRQNLLENGSFSMILDRDQTPTYMRANTFIQLDGGASTNVQGNPPFRPSAWQYAYSENNANDGQQDWVVFWNASKSDVLRIQPEHVMILRDETGSNLAPEALPMVENFGGIIQADTTYELRFDVSNRKDRPFAGYWVQVEARDSLGNQSILQRISHDNSPSPLSYNSQHIRTEITEEMLQGHDGQELWIKVGIPDLQEEDIALSIFDNFVLRTIADTQLEIPYVVADSCCNFALTAYPNPVQDVVNIRFYTTACRDYELRVLDPSGRPLQQQSEEVTSIGEHISQMNLSGLASGYYLLVLYDEGEVVDVEKIMVE